LDILFSSDKLKSLYNNRRKLIKKHGADRASRIGKRLDDLRAADTLEDMRSLPGRCHELKGNRTGQFSLDLDHPYRLIFTPVHDPIPRKTDGGWDWTQINTIKILGVEDTHK